VVVVVVEEDEVVVVLSMQKVSRATKLNPHFSQPFSSLCSQAHTLSGSRIFQEPWFPVVSTVAPSFVN
jgi:hypothetical protein